MKKILLSLSCALSLGAVTAQTNLSFEAWSGTDPDDWTTSNQISAIGGPITVVQETANPGTGLISAHLTVEPCGVCAIFSLPDPFPGLMLQQTPSTARPLTLSFKWRGNIATGDTALIGGAVTLAGTQIGDAYLNVTPINQATWVTENINFTYYSGADPDTITLGALTDGYLLLGGTGTTSSSTEIYVDDYILSGTASGISEILPTNNNLILAYPNPATDFVYMNLLGTDASTLEVLDVTGKVVYTRNGLLAKQNIDVTGFENGSYVARFYNDKKEYVGTARFNVTR